MSLQPGDRVVVLNAGTDYARAVKVQPVQVGDRVTVIELSDGTKLPLPRLKIDISDYVFVIPVWDDSFDINGPYTYEMLPLGMCVFTVTGKTCYVLEDDYREWESGSLAGMQVIMLSGNRRYQVIETTNEDGSVSKELQNVLPISTNTATTYLISDDEVEFPSDLGFDNGFLIWSPITTFGYITPPAPNGTFHVELTAGYMGLQQTCDVSGAIRVVIRWRGLMYASYQNHPVIYLMFVSSLASDSVSFSAYDNSIVYPENVTLRINPSYPDYDDIEIFLPFTANHFNTVLSVRVLTSGGAWCNFDFDSLTFYDENGNEMSKPCTTGGVAVGDKYVIYDPTAKKIIANDAAKTTLAAANWRAVVTPGEEITLAAVEYAWDGAGYVYLTSSKTTFAQIAYHTQIRITATAAGETKVIDWHTGAAYSYDGLTISSELTHITSILRPGSNTITISVRDVSATKIGFAAPVYIRRNMAALH